MRVLPAIVLTTALAFSRAATADPWAVTFERSCGNYRIEPSLAPDETTLDACGLRFDAGSGRFLSRPDKPVLATLAPGGVLVTDEDRGGLAIASPGARRLRWTGATVDAYAISQDGTRVATLERWTERGRRSYRIVHGLFVRELPSLRELNFVRLDVPDGASDGAAVGFLADGRVGVLAPQSDCGDGPDSVPCVGATVQVLDAAGALAPLSPALGSVVRAGFAPDGLCAAVALADGGLRLVSLGDGSTLATLPTLPGVQAVAASAGGTRIAAATDDAVRVFARGDAETSLDARQYSVRSLRFSHDGRALVAAGPESVAVYREGAPRIASHAMTYAPTMPPDFEAARIDEGFVRWPSEEYTETYHPGREFQSLAEYRATDNTMLAVGVMAGSADEFDPGAAADAWARAVIARYLGAEELRTARQLRAAHLRTWGSPGARGASLDFEREDGCEIEHFFWRFQERDGLLYRGDIQGIVPAPERIAALRTALFDAPLGAPP